MYRGRAEIPHGIRARYARGCRCELCRTANKEYERKRIHAIRDRVWDIKPDKAVKHIAYLREAGIGIRAIARLSGTARSILQKILNGQPTRFGAERERAILAIKIKDAQKIQGSGLVDAKPTWKLIEKLLDLGLTRGEIAQRAFGVRRPRLQLRRDRVMRSTAEAIAGLWHKVKEEYGIEFRRKFCTKCGHSHALEARLERVARFLKLAYSAEEIVEALPCLYGATPSEIDREVVTGRRAGHRMLMRDLACLRGPRSRSLKKDHGSPGGGGGVRSWILAGATAPREVRR